MTDDQERQVAAEIERSHPNWMVLWGCYSRLFWAYPRFLVPRGTIVSAPNGDMLLADMHSVEVEARASQQVAAYNPPSSPAQLPRRLSRGQAQRGALSRVAPATDALSVASRQEDMSGPSLVPNSRLPASPIRGSVAAAIPGPQRAAQPATRSQGPFAADPYEFSPHAADPYEFDPYAVDPDESDPYSSDPYSSDPYESGPYESNSAGQN